VLTYDRVPPIWLQIEADVRNRNELRSDGATYVFDLVPGGGTFEVVLGGNGLPAVNKIIRFDRLFS